MGVSNTNVHTLTRTSGVSKHLNIFKTQRYIMVHSMNVYHYSQERTLKTLSYLFLVPLFGEEGPIEILDPFCQRVLVLKYEGIYFR